MVEQQIVVVEDEALIAASVAARLRAEGFDVTIAADGPDGVEACRRIRPALVVLDVMLPGLDGIEVCRRVQGEQPGLPVIMLTARDAETDVLVGLGVGADDYVTKPFSPRELVARIRAVLRRVDRTPFAGGDRRILGVLEIDGGTRRVRVRGEEVHLTPTEFALLSHLAERPGFVVSRSRLLVEVWGYNDGTGERTVDTHVAALRRKLGSGVLRTVHGVGYALEEQPGP
jgi:DNA-binding response OmpR family regulator